jgi:ActR/RegA family two-component response regulator
MLHSRTHWAGSAANPLRMTERATASHRFAVFSTMPPKRLLVVDDDQTIVALISGILQQRGFEVSTATSVPEALRVINSGPIDVLLSDLNIGQPGDGFTVVSAVRRTYPDAVAIILTGFPDIDIALRAIRDQVDQILVKPIHPDRLVQVIERDVRTGTRHRPLAIKRISELIRENKDTIMENCLERIMKISSERFPDLHCSPEEMRNNLPHVIEESCDRVDSRQNDVNERARSFAAEHGRLRRRQGYDPIFMLNENTTIRQEILEFVHENLLVLNLSYLFMDLTLISDALDDQLEIAMRAFLEKG